MGRFLRPIDSTMNSAQVIDFITSPGMIVIYVFTACTLVVHYRGKVRFSVQRQLTSFTTFLSPINVFMYLFSKVPNRPFMATDTVPNLDKLKANWRVILDEAKQLQDSGEVKISEKLDDVAFNSFFRRGWKRFYITWYGKTMPSARALCPQTVALIESIPNIKGAMFTVLPSGSELMRHRDPYAGSLRYHLGLDTPNSDACRIFVDGEEYAWRDGEDVLFDETYIHWAENKTDKDRIILFCDVERPMNNLIAQWLNKLFGYVLVAAGRSRNNPGESVGFLNKIFSLVYPIRKAGRKLKTINQPLYYLIKYLIFAGLLYLIIF